MVWGIALQIKRIPNCAHDFSMFPVGSNLDNLNDCITVSTSYRSALASVLLSCCCSKHFSNSLNIYTTYVHIYVL